MNWITTDQVKAAAKRGEIPALECSLEHHQQGRDADWVELKAAMESGKFDTAQFFCACCARVGNNINNFKYHRCEDCPLFVKQGGTKHWCCDDIWSKSLKAFYKLKGDYSNANFKAFQEAESKVCDYIEDVLEKKRAEEKEPLPDCNLCKHYSNLGSPCNRCGPVWGKKSMFEPKKESTPALRHGELRLWHGDSNLNLPVIVDLSEEDARIIFNHSYENKKPMDCHYEKDSILDWSDHISYPLDDLKRNSEDLEKFEIKVMGGAKIRLQVEGQSIIIRNLLGVASASLDEATEIAHKILQEVATAKRKT